MADKKRRAPSAGFFRPWKPLSHSTLNCREKSSQIFSFPLTNLGPWPPQTRNTNGKTWQNIPHFSEGETEEKNVMRFAHERGSACEYLRVCVRCVASLKEERERQHQSLGKTSFCANCRKKKTLSFFLLPAFAQFASFLVNNGVLVYGQRRRIFFWS